MIQDLSKALSKGGVIPIIKSISSFRNQPRAIAILCHEQDEPVYLTTNGEGDLVVMSIEHYERLKAKVKLFGKLAVAQARAVAGEKGVTHSQVMKNFGCAYMANKNIVHGKTVEIESRYSRFTQFE